MAALCWGRPRCRIDRLGSAPIPRQRRSSPVEAGDARVWGSFQVSGPAEVLEARDGSVALEADIFIDVVDADVTGGFDD